MHVIKVKDFESAAPTRKKQRPKTAAVLPNRWTKPSKTVTWRGQPNSRGAAAGVVWRSDSNEKREKIEFNKKESKQNGISHLKNKNVSGITCWDVDVVVWIPAHCI